VFVGRAYRCVVAKPLILSGTCGGVLECSPGVQRCVHFSANTFIFQKEIEMCACFYKKSIGRVVRASVGNLGVFFMEFS
jgi:hypothetical protein